MNIGNLTAYIGADMSDFQKKMAMVEGRMQQASQKMMSAGRKMSMSLTLPLVALGAASFKAFKDYESNMSKIVGLVGVSRDQVNAWGDDIKKMSIEVGRSMTELSDAMFFVTSAGLRGAEAMEVLEMSARASAAGLGETKTVADLVTSAINAYGAENLSAAQATDILVASVREGKAEASELAGSLGSVLPVASEMGVTFDQVGAAIAAMTRTGTNAQTAATQLNAIMASLLKTTPQAEKALNKMGLSGAELRRVMREDGLIVAMEQLREATNMYGEDMMGQVIPNIRALRGILDLMGSNAEENKKIFDSLTNSTGALDHAFEAASQTAEFKWNQSLTRVKTSFVTLGAQLQGVIVPLLEKLSKAVERVAEWFDGLSEGGQKTVLIMAGLAAAAGPVLIVTANLIRAFVTLKKAIVAVNAVMMKNPFVAAGVAIAAVALAINRLTRNTDELSEAQQKLLDIQKDAILEEQKQTTTLNSLFDALKKTTYESKERLKIIRLLKDEHGVTIMNYSDTVKWEGELKRAYNEGTAALKNRITQQVYQSKLAVLEAERQNYAEKVLEADRELRFHKELERKGRADKDSRAFREGAVQRLLKYNRELQKTTRELDQLAQKSTDLSIQMATIFEDDGDDGGGGGGSFGGGGTDGIEEARTAYERLTDQIDKLKSSLQDMAQQRVESGDISIVDEQSIREQLIGLERLKEAIDEAMQFPDQALTDTKSKLAQMRAELEKHGKSEKEIRDMALQQDLVRIDNEKQLKLTKLIQGEKEYLQTEKQYLELAQAMRDAHADKEKQLAEDVTAKKKEELDKQINQIGYALMSERERLVEQYKAIALQIEEAFDAKAITSMTEKLRLLQGVLQETGKELMKIDKPEMFGVDAFENIERWYQANKNAMSQLYEDQDGFYKAMSELNKQYSQMQLSAVKMVAEGALDTFSKLFGVLKGFYKEGSDDYKKFARAQIIMDTARAAMAAYAAMAGIPAVGPALGVAAAAAAVAAGALQLKELETASYPGAATGGKVTSGGGVVVGEDGPEVLNLKPGSVVHSNPEVRVNAAITKMTSAIKGIFADVGTLNGGLTGQISRKSYIMSGIRGGDYSIGDERLVTRIKGRDLEIVLERSQAQSKRR